MSWAGSQNFHYLLGERLHQIVVGLRFLRQTVAQVVVAMVMGGIEEHSHMVVVVETSVAVDTPVVVETPVVVDYSAQIET